MCTCAARSTSSAPGWWRSTSRASPTCSPSSCWESHGFDDLLAQSDYRSRIQTLDSDIVNRVRDLRNESKATVEEIRAAREEIAARKAEIDRVRVDLVSRNRAMKTARTKQRSVLKRVDKHAKDLEGDLSKASKEVQKQLGSYVSPLEAGPIIAAGGGFIWPVNGTITSGFGMRWGSMHEGIDIAAPGGTPIRAAMSGTIVIAAPTGGYGNYTWVSTTAAGCRPAHGHQSSFARTGPIRRARCSATSARPATAPATICTSRSASTARPWIRWVTCEEALKHSRHLPITNLDECDLGTGRAFLTSQASARAAPWSPRPRSPRCSC